MRIHLWRQKTIREFFTYDRFDKLKQVKLNDNHGRILEEYLYDHEGNRIRKTQYFKDGSNETTYYIGKNFVRIINNTGTYDQTYYYANHQLVAKNKSGTIEFFHGDHLGSTTLITDEAGEEVAYQEYLPFTASITDETNEERLYTGQTLDDTGIYYYGARYYDPELRRFTQPDPIMNPYNPQNLNRYAYTLNNPVKFIFQ